MDFDASLLVVMGAFWVAYWIIRSSYIKPMTALLEGRRHEVESARELYDLALAESESELEAQRTRLAETRLGARQRREEVLREANSRRQEVLAEAKRAAGDQLDRAEKELDAQVKEQRTSLEREARDLADQMARRLLGRAV